MNVNPVLRKDYKKETLSEYGKNKPNSKPIKANFRAKQTQSNPISNPKRQVKTPEFTTVLYNSSSKLSILHKNLRANSFPFFAGNPAKTCNNSLSSPNAE